MVLKQYVLGATLLIAGLSIPILQAMDGDHLFPHEREATYTNTTLYLDNVLRRCRDVYSNYTQLSAKASLNSAELAQLSVLKENMIRCAQDWIEHTQDAPSTLSTLRCFDGQYY